VIESLGDALAGSGKPLVVTSGTLVLPAGRIGTESDAPDPAAPAAPRAAGERAALALAGRGVRASVARLAPCVHERVKRGFAGALVDAAQRSGYAGYLGDGSQGRKPQGGRTTAPWPARTGARWRAFRTAGPRTAR
jgi:hypothetical protein